MPLRDVDEYRAWVEREAPSRPVRSAVRTYVAELVDWPSRPPSVVVPDLSNLPTYEVRMARLDLPDIEPAIHVWYLHELATGVVDLLLVTHRPGLDDL